MSRPFGYTTRRTMLKIAGATGAVVGLGGVSMAQQGADFQLEGVTSGWVGQAPDEIEGETNPTLDVVAGEEYVVEWTNGDGAGHNFAIENDAGEVVFESDIMDDEGETQTVEFTVEEDFAEYFCQPHSGSMRGTLAVGDEEPAPDEPDVPEQIADARQISPRDVDNHNYKALFDYRKRRAIETLLSDPEVNETVDNFVTSFEAYDPLSEHFETVSIQGSPDLEIEGSIEDEFEVTALDRQVAYGVVNRWTDELVAAHVTEPEDVSWSPWDHTDEGERRLRFITDNSEVQEHLDGNEWYPSFKVAESITGYLDVPHAGASPAVLFVQEDDGEVVAVTAYLDVRDPDEYEMLDVQRIEDFVEFPPHELAATVGTRDESVLEDLPDVPFEKRPWYTANNGHHRQEEIPESIEQNSWQIDWEPPGTHGVTIDAAYNGKPVFAQLDAPVTYTGYGLPPRDGRNISEWYFPDDDPVFNGHLLFWDIHSIDFGGPGELGIIDYPETPEHPGGFRFRTHYHTGATGRASTDFHSGYRFGPYNYDISYEFFEDGVVRPIWRRQGPGFIMEHLEHHDDHEEHDEDTVIQHYTSTFAMDVTPGTTEGTEVRLFDGNEWTSPSEEFYIEGEPGMKARFCNPDGEERIDIPLDDDTELVVVRRRDGEFPLAERALDMDVEEEFYHPSQYMRGDSIQGERVIVWLMFTGAVGQLPHPSGITSFALDGRINLHGY